MEEEGEKTVPGRGSSKCAGLKARGTSSSPGRLGWRNRCVGGAIDR